MKFNERLRELRKTSNLTQDQCAKSLGISTVAWRQYEQGTRSPKPDALLQIAVLFNVSLDDLLCLDDFKKSLSTPAD